LKVLVTGANGYLGKRVVPELLRRGHSVRVLVRPAARLDALPWAGEVEIHRADLRASADLEGLFSEIDVLVHLAAAMTGDDEARFAATVTGTEQLLEAMAKSATRRVVLASSFSVYNWHNIQGVLDESSPIEEAPGLYTRDGYAIAKVWQERIARDLAVRHGFHLTVFRPGFIWGEGDQVLSSLTQKIGSVHVVIGPRMRLPLTHVENCASCFAAAAEDPSVAGETFNVVDHDDIRLWSHVGDCLKRSGQRAVRVPVPYRLALAVVSSADWVNRRAFGGKARLPSILVLSRFQARFKPLRFSNEKARKVLNWQPQAPRSQPREWQGVLSR